MKDVFHAKNKIKAAIVLLVMMLLLLGHHVIQNMRFTDVDASVNSIYNDRLMPATYLFRMSNHMYQVRLLLENNKISETDLAKQLEAHDQHINQLINNYETTYLTQEETKAWQLFKENLALYRQVRAATEKEAEADAYFAAVMDHLRELNKIQEGEGYAIHQDIQGTLQGAQMESSFEVIIAMVFGVMALILIRMPDKPFLKAVPKGSSLN